MPTAETRPEAGNGGGWGGKTGLPQFLGICQARVMQRLGDVIRALRTELSEALGPGSALPGNCRWVGQHIEVELGFAVVTDPEFRERCEFVVVAREGAAQHLKLVLEPGAGMEDLGTEPTQRGQAGAQPRAKEAGVAGIGLAEGPALAVAELSPVFGAPGFDSSARATVFREALAALSPEEAAQALAQLGSAEATGSVEVDRARHFIRRVIQSGGGDVGEGVATLQRWAAKLGLDGLVNLVREAWAEQAEWLRRSAE
jgi:hypothetical protein